MALELKDVMKVKLSVNPVDAAGNPGVIDGKPTWASSDETILTVLPADDGMTAYAVAIGPLGAAQVQVKADADLGEGVKEISGTLDVVVVGSEAVSLSVAAGTPEPK